MSFQKISLTLMQVVKICISVSVGKKTKGEK